MKWPITLGAPGNNGCRAPNLKNLMKKYYILDILYFKNKTGNKLT